MLVAAPLASAIPLAALAGVLAIVAWNMAEKQEFATLIRSSRADAVLNACDPRLNPAIFAAAFDAHFQPAGCAQRAVDVHRARDLGDAVLRHAAESLEHALVEFRMSHADGFEVVPFEDLTAEVFHQALAGIGRFQWRGAPFAAWLLGIAANVLADRWQHSANTARSMKIGCKQD